MKIELTKKEKDWIVEECMNTLGYFKDNTLGCFKYGGSSDLTIENYKSFDFNKGIFCELAKEDYDIIISLLDKLNLHD